jgi:hypothetical protein
METEADIRTVTFVCPHTSYNKKITGNVIARTACTKRNLQSCIGKKKH